MLNNVLEFVLTEISRPVEVCAESVYRILGVKWYAKGAWIKQTCKGKDIKANTLYKVRAGDMIYNRLFAWKGSFAVISEDLDGCYVSGEYPVFRVKEDKAHVEYIHMLLSQPFIWNEIERRSKGVASISRNRLKVCDFLSLELPLPDLEQQTSILNKYSKTKILCARLSAKFEQNMDDINHLRQAILQLAVHGELVPQDPNDEPASILIKKIEAEKKKLIKEGKIKKQKPLPPINPDDMAYELPKGWEWVRLTQLGITRTGTTPPKNHPEYYGSGHPFIKPADIFNSDVDYTQEQITDLGLANGRLVPANSALMVCIGGSIGKVGYADRNCSCNQQINFVSPLAGMDGRFIAYWMKAPYFQREVLARAPQTTLPILSKGKWEVIEFSLPPLAEQKRIVIKVDQLMALRDELEARLMQTQSIAETLMGAVVNELTAVKLLNY